VISLLVVLLGSGLIAGCHAGPIRTLGRRASERETVVSYIPTGSAAATISEHLAGLPTVGALPAWGSAYRGVVDGVRTRQGAVALTFDDGPTAHTREIVDELQEFGAHATFFWVGSRITTGAALYSISHGEELANHTWTHPNMKGLTSEEASQQIGWTSARIAAFTGSPPIWFRSPYNRLYTAEHEQVRAHGLLYANYDISSLDWIAGASEQSILAEVTRGLHPGGVILMHDSPTHDPASYLPGLLSELKARGYSMVTLSTLAQMGPPDVYRMRRYHAELLQGHDTSL
jgi:peptidoglycan/xylan/chitin deacetylase (PgdA/CDA1 family)